MSYHEARVGETQILQYVTFPNKVGSKYDNPYGTAFGSYSPIRHKSTLRLAGIMQDRGFAISVKPAGYSRSGFDIHCQNPAAAMDFEIMTCSPEFEVIEYAERAVPDRIHPVYPDMNIYLENDLRRTNWPTEVKIGLIAYGIYTMAQNALALAFVAEGAEYDETAYTGNGRWTSRDLQPAEQWRETAFEFEDRAQALLREHQLLYPIGEAKLRHLLLQAIEDRLHPPSSIPFQVS